MSKWKGTVRFTLADDNGKVHTITLSNVSYFPLVDRNFVSITAWENAHEDDAEVRIKGKYSILNGGDGKF